MQELVVAPGGGGRGVGGINLPPPPPKKKKKKKIVWVGFFCLPSWEIRFVFLLVTNLPPPPPPTEGLAPPPFWNPGVATVNNEVLLCPIPGVIRKCEGTDFPMVLSPGAGVKELTQVTLSDTGVTVGSGVTVSQLEEELQKLVDQLPGELDLCDQTAFSW